SFVRRELFGRALAVMERARDQYPEDWRVLLMLAMALQLVGASDRMEPIFKRVVEIGPPESIGPTSMAYGLFLEAAARWLEAETFYLRALEHGADRTRSELRLAIVRAHLGRVDRLTDVAARAATENDHGTM